MEFRLQIPDEAVSYILYQRTQYLRTASTLPYRLSHRLFPQATLRFTVGLESRLRREPVKDRYAKSMSNEYESLRPFLPSACAAVLDIGCGVAGVDPFIAQHYREPVDFYLLDRTATDRRIVYEFRPRAAFYNSLQAAQRLLVLNGIPVERIHLLQADERNSVPVDREIDLVLSLLAWGFHFPVGTYLDRVHDLLSARGALILDVSRQSKGIEELKDKFASVEVILEREAYFRVLAKK